MKYDGYTGRIMVLCDRCIRAVRSRGEKIYVSDLMDNECFNTCMWCFAPDDELFKVAFDVEDELDDEPEGRNGKCRW